MRYEPPVEKSFDEIKSGLDQCFESDEKFMGLMLSALYYLDTEQAGDILIEQFSRSVGERKSYLMNLLSTFYGMHRTIYRLDDSLQALQEYRIEAPEMEGDINCMYDEIVERREIYLRNTKDAIT